MTNSSLIECVPNFSEGKDPEVIKYIADAIRGIKRVKLLHIDIGYGANRTVMTFAGTATDVIDAAFRAVEVAARHIDMRHHQGTHPRIGATDVCPLVPLQDVPLLELVPYAHHLGRRIGEELNIPVYLYEAAATHPGRINLAAIRAGEYEGLSRKIQQPAWKPDYGPSIFNAKSGATVVGVRNLLIAYNVNLNTTDKQLAMAIACDVRESGRVKRSNTGEILRDQEGIAIRIPGSCKAVKAIGWFIEEYGRAQVSMNLIDFRISSLHHAFEACRESAFKYGVAVTGSEIIGLVPLRAILDAGRYYSGTPSPHRKMSEDQLIKLAIQHLGLDELAPFDPQQKIIEYCLES